MDDLFSCYQLMLILPLGANYILVCLWLSIYLYVCGCLYTCMSMADLSSCFPADADRARKHGMEEYIAADPITFDHHDLFQELQRLSLDWRLLDPFASLVHNIENSLQHTTHQTCTIKVVRL